MLAFSAQKPESSPFKDRHYSATSMFTEALETTLTFEEIEEKPSIAAQLLSTVKNLLSSKQTKDDSDFSQMGEAIQTVAEHVKDLPEQLAAAKAFSAELNTRLDQLKADLTTLTTQLSNTGDTRQPKRPVISGGDNHVVTDC